MHGVVCGAISWPFQGCHDTLEKPYLQLYVFTMLLPVGIGMGAFHVSFLKIRRGPGAGPGRAIADGATVGCCVLGQTFWLAIWYAWLRGISSSCGGLEVAPLTVGLSFIGSTIIVTVNVLRLYLFIKCRCDCAKFAERYTGADFTNESQGTDAKLYQGITTASPTKEKDGPVDAV